MAKTISDLADQRVGGKNDPGIVGDIFMIPTAALNKTGPFTITGHTLSTDLVAISGEGWASVHREKKSGKIGSTPTGSEKGAGRENTLEFFTPGDSDALSQLEEKIQNRDMVVAARDKDGNMRLYGVSIIGGALSFEAPAMVSTSSDGGETGGDARGTSFTVKSYATHKPLFYTGAISTAEVS